MKVKHYETLKKEYIGHIADYVKEAGGLFPHISIFAEPKDKKDTKPALIHVPIPDDYMQNEEGKDEFLDEVLPGIAKKVNQMFDVYAIAWSSEAWMRVADKESDVQDYKSLAKKEVIFISIESIDKSECVMYNIKRFGKQINSDGDLVDTIKLTKSRMSGQQNIGGRFSGLLKHFKKGGTDD
jgi:hypothetical protein